MPIPFTMIPSDIVPRFRLTRGFALSLPWHFGTICACPPSNTPPETERNPRIFCISTLIYRSNRVVICPIFERAVMSSTISSTIDKLPPVLLFRGSTLRRWSSCRLCFRRASKKDLFASLRLPRAVVDSSCVLMVEGYMPRSVKKGDPHLKYAAFGSAVNITEAFPSDIPTYCSLRFTL